MNKAIFYGLPVGVTGGAFLSLAGLVAPVTGLSLGCIYGLTFCMVAKPRANTPGAGLLWDLAFTLVFWLAGRPPSDLILCPPYQDRQSC